MSRYSGWIVLAAVIAGCGGGQVRTAPFRVRPDSVDPGSLVGPFDGKVVDSRSGDPVAGALVYATWTFQTGYGLQAPAGFREAVTSTDANGRYQVAAVPDMPDDSHLTDFFLVIYKRGYVAYRSDRRFEDLGPRLDFAQHQNQVRMDRWRNDYSHVRHLRYVGGGSALMVLTSWEAEEAAAELTGVKEGPRVATDLVIQGRGGVSASQIVTEQDIRAMTGFDGTFETGPLNDEADTDAYSSQHFRALGQPESFDVSVRLWKLDSAAAETRYGELLESLPKVEQSDEIADKSLRATEEQIHGVAYFDRSRGVVVMLTCGVSQCKSVDALVAIGRKSYERVKRQVPAGAGQTVEPGEPAPEPAPAPGGEP